MLRITAFNVPFFLSTKKIFFSWRLRALKKKFEKRGKVVLAEALAPFIGTRGSRTPLPEPGEVRNLLIIRQHNQMGDMLLAVPAFRGIRKRFPNARITLLAASINSGVMQNNPFVDEVITWSKERHRRDPLAFLRFIHHGQRFSFHGLNFSCQTSAFAENRIPMFIAFSCKNRH